MLYCSGAEGLAADHGKTCSTTVVPPTHTLSEDHKVPPSHGCSNAVPANESVDEGPVSRASTIRLAEREATYPYQVPHEILRKTLHKQCMIKEGTVAKEAQCISSQNLIHSNMLRYS